MSSCSMSSSRSSSDLSAKQRSSTGERGERLVESTRKGPSTQGQLVNFLYSLAGKLC